MQISFSNIASLIGLMLAGCATTTATTRKSGTTAHDDTVVTPATPVCKARSRLLAPSKLAVGAAAMLADEQGYAMIWTEQLTLRFLSVDRRGAARSPSAELVDRASAPSAPALVVDADGYRASWSEGEARYERRIDAHGRARSDIATSKIAAVEAPSRCTSGATIRCIANGNTLELPANDKPLAESLDGSGPAVIAAGDEGLSLWVLDCGAK